LFKDGVFGYFRGRDLILGFRDKKTEEGRVGGDGWFEFGEGVLNFSKVGFGAFVLDYFVFVL